jgi:hypothetical protein
MFILPAESSGGGDSRAAGADNNEIPGTLGIKRKGGFHWLYLNLRFILLEILSNIGLDPPMCKRAWVRAMGQGTL